MGNEITKTEGTDLLSIIKDAATNPGFNGDNMKQLLDMQERIMVKQAEINFNGAMNRLGPKLPVIHKGSEIKHGEKLIARYAKYEEIDPVIRPLYSAEGFSVSFTSKEKDGKTTYYGFLSHVDGHTRTAEIVLPVDTGGAKSAVQAVLSTVSYAKRTLVSMLFNLVYTNEDDNGMLGSKTIDTEQAATLDTLLRETKSNVPAFCRLFGVEAVTDIPAGKYQDAYQQVQNKARSQKNGATA